MDKEKLVAALGELDHSNDEHWNKDGKPNIDALIKLMGEAVKRGQLDDVAPNFVRVQGEGAPDPVPSNPEDPAEIVQLVKDFVWAMRLTVEEFQANPDLCREALELIQKEIQNDVTEIGNIRNRIKRAEVAIRDINALYSTLQNPTNPVLDYIKRQNETRQAQAARAKAFIDSGTNAQDVAAALDTRSQLDRTLNQRKAAPGSTRPSRLPSHL